MLLSVRSSHVKTRRALGLHLHQHALAEAGASFWLLAAEVNQAAPGICRQKEPAGSAPLRGWAKCVGELAVLSSRLQQGLRSALSSNNLKVRKVYLVRASGGPTRLSSCNGPSCCQTSHAGCQAERASLHSFRVCACTRSFVSLTTGIRLLFPVRLTTLPTASDALSNALPQPRCLLKDLSPASQFVSICSKLIGCLCARKFQSRHWWQMTGRVSKAWGLLVLLCLAGKSAIVLINLCATVLRTSSCKLAGKAPRSSK